MAGRVKVNDRRLRAFRQRIKGLKKGIHATVGVQGEMAQQDHPNGAMTMATLAAIHEFGAPSANIPQRSFLRSTFDENRKKYRAMVRKGARAAAAGRGSMKSVMFQTGEMLRADIIKKIKAGIPPRLKDATVDRKGSTTPLIDKGHLIGAISSQVRDGKEVVRA